MSYLPPFEAIKRRFKITVSNGKGRITLSHQDFLELIKLMLRGVALDDRWYLNEYPDVADAVREGRYRSAKHHFVEEGYLEGRRPANVAVDEEWYLRAYPDVADGVVSGAFLSPQTHFELHGYAEGRLPSEY